jgi:hypothetical protein
MTQAEIHIRRGQLVAVLLANAILWVAAIFLAGTPKLGGPAVIALISISSLLVARPQNC